MSIVNVLIVDDSAVVRQVISGVLSKDRSIRIAAAVADPLFAMQRMRTQWPDVIVLDVEMPRMDGITFLKKIMTERPTAVVICSTLTSRGAESSMQALAAGAFAIIEKPKIGIKDFLVDDSADLAKVVKAAARANLRNLAGQSLPAGPLDGSPDPDVEALSETRIAWWQSGRRPAARSRSNGCCRRCLAYRPGWW